MKNETITTLTLCGAGTALLLLFGLWMCSEKHIHGYYLDGSGGSHNNGVPSITVDINNAPDGTIHLSKEISSSEAMHMVDSLNKSLESK